MDAREHLFYGLGIIAYAVAHADGKIQYTERNELRSIIEEWSKTLDIDFDGSAVIFSMLSKDKLSLEDGYDLGMKNILLGRDYLNEKLKERFTYLISDIAHSFPPVTKEEEKIIERFSQELNRL